MLERVGFSMQCGISTLLVAFALSALACDGNDYVPVDAPLGKGSFTTQAGPATNLTVYYYIPKKAAADSPIVIALHGDNRDAEGMRDDWIAKADAYGCMVFSPLFDDTQFPGGDGYILGNVFVDGDNPSAATQNPESAWSFSVIEPLFDVIREFTGAEATRYDLFGHSAGAQFVHRFVEFTPDARIEHAVAANAGWYTMPDPSIDYPYGLRLAPVTSTSYFADHLTILAGDKDTDPNSADLRHNEQADAQGLNRFTRSEYFYDNSRVLAGSATFNWERIVVPNVGHSDADMAAAAADYLYE